MKKNIRYAKLRNSEKKRDIRKKKKKIMKNKISWTIFDPTISV